MEVRRLEEIGTPESYSLRQITGYELKLMDGPPFTDYTFLFHIGPYEEVGGGGMEHANSTAISAPSPEAAAAIAAHEFFHAWNVKRIRPQTLEPVDYSKEQYTRALWFAEGVTSAYASFTPLNARDCGSQGAVLFPISARRSRGLNLDPRTRGRVWRNRPA